MTENGVESRQAQIEARLRAREAKRQRAPSIPRRPLTKSWLSWLRGAKSEAAFLSAAQKRVWILYQLDPSSAVFNRPLALRLYGELDRSALTKAVDEIVRRHEALRTVFPEHDGEPRQVVLPAAAVPVEFQDFQGVAAATREREVRRAATIEAQRTFDLANGPVLRLRLLRADERDHVLLVLMHHIVFDGWSENVFIQELQQLYTAFARRQAPVLTELPIQYSDFAAWQQGRLEDKEIAREVAYWRSELEGIPASLRLPADFPRRGTMGSESGVCRLDLGAGLTLDLKELSRRERVSLFMTLLSAFQFLLAYHADADDIVVGVPVAGRTRLETEALIGCFMNVLAMRASLAGNPTVRELLARVRETALQAYANQEAPLEKIIEAVRPERRADQWPLFQVLFQLRNLPKPETPDASGLDIRPFKFDTGVIGGLDLDLEIEEVDGELRCSLRYDSSLFRRETVERMLDRLRNVLAAMVRHPEGRVWDMPVLGGAERHRLLHEWNDTATAFSEDGCIHELFERQVERTPDAIAVVFEGQQLTYRELNQRANQLAHALRKLGARPETLVAICLERSLEMVVGLLGILKSGAAYLPLDPDYPRERLAYLVRDSRARIVLTQQPLAERIEQAAVQVLCLDTGWGRICREDSGNPESGVSSNNLAYVIYTSGSTGEPKGAMIEHRSVSNHLRWRKDYYRLSENDRFLQRASISFDDSVWEFFAPLTVGARLVMMRPEGQLDNAYMVELMRREQITFACFVPSMLRVLLEEPGISDCTSLRWLETGGEVLPVEVQEQCFAKLRAGLSNGYGPTEATVACTYFRCQPNGGGGRIPIGRPVANTQIYILGRHGQLLPAGAPGELCVGGAGLARGYLGRPELTSQKFIRNPFSNETEARLYRTGDLARYLPDGNIEFLGRLDHQVKVRGFRIELEEVEGALREHPAVHAAAVAARQDQAENTMLVGYFVLQSGQTASNDLRSFLRQKLPDYMVPTFLIQLDSLPHLTSGKVDRAALPDPQTERSEPGEVDLPRSATEERVAKIWLDVLGTRAVGRNDDFFSLGGRSLSAARVIQSVRQAFGIKVKLLDLFRYPTVAGMAGLIDSLLARSAGREA